MSIKPFESIDPAALATVAGGASRVSAKSGGNDQLTAMLTQITSSIKDLASSQSAGMDPMMMVMMMMMGGRRRRCGTAMTRRTRRRRSKSTRSPGGCGGRGKKGW